jgi:predicted Zn-dependent protease
MRSLNAIAALALALSALSAKAQADTTGAHSPEAYFNRASRQYVKEDKSSAMRVLDEGLREHPGDAKLLKLAEQLLKEDRQQKQAQQQQQQQEDDQKQEQGQEQKQAQEQNQEQERNSRGMDKRDAERMLDELNREEQDVQERVRARSMPGRKARIEKDW